MSCWDLALNTNLYHARLLGTLDYVLRLTAEHGQASRYCKVSLASAISIPAYLVVVVIAAAVVVAVKAGRNVN